jgi:hypothetical protein
MEFYIFARIRRVATEWQFVTGYTESAKAKKVFLSGHFASAQYVCYSQLNFEKYLKEST